MLTVETKLVVLHFCAYFNTGFTNKTKDSIQIAISS